jgi:uncharacterized protein YndB with AHSA1/START domain
MTELREAEAPAGTPLVVHRSYAASAEQVFDAWLDREQMARFLFATPDGTMQRVEVDPQIGGRFRIDEQRQSGLACHYGEYVAIERPRRLVFRFTTDQAQPPTEVTIAIDPTGGGSLLTLSHLVDPAWENFRERTRHGWTMILDTLAPLVERA